MGAAVKPAKSGDSRFARPKGGAGFKSPIDKAKPYEVEWASVSGIFSATRTLSNVRFVYAIGEKNGPIKIGVAKDPISRLRSMQTGNPRRLRVERVVCAEMETEKLLHELWEEFAIVAPHRKGKVDVAPGTEWFRPEIRKELFPILEGAVEDQLEYLDLSSRDAPPSFAGMDRIVRHAHWHAGVEPKGRDHVLLMASGGGYVIAGRRSRL